MDKTFVRTIRVEEPPKLDMNYSELLTEFQKLQEFSASMKSIEDDNNELIQKLMKENESYKELLSAYRIILKDLLTK